MAERAQQFYYGAVASNFDPLYLFKHSRAVVSDHFIPQATRRLVSPRHTEE